MWVTKLLISQVKKKDFLPQNDQIWPKIGIFGQFGPGQAGLLNALLWVGLWLWRAGCISQDTYLLYGFDHLVDIFSDKQVSIRATTSLSLSPLVRWLLGESATHIF